MKTILSIVTLFFAFAAQAQVRTPISEVQDLQYDGNILKVRYSMGGGCASHHPEFNVSLKKEDQYSVVAIVTVTDVSDKEDPCEAMMTLQGKVDLKSMINEMISKMPDSNNIYRIKAQLPNVNVNF